MKHLRYLLLAALVVMPLTACDEDTDPVTTVYGTIQGTVGAEGVGLSGVTIAVTGAKSYSATTGLGGTYTIENVEAGSYGVTIISVGIGDVIFSTTSQETVIAREGDVQTVNFEGTYIRTASISGTVAAGTTGLASVDVAITGGPDNVSISKSTGLGGEYSASGLRAGTYAVTISNTPAGVEFISKTKNVTVTTGESGTAHFIGISTQVSTVSGAVVVDNVGTAGVAVALSGDATASTETSAGGAFAFTNLAPGTYTVTITPPEGTEFTVTSKNVTVGLGETGVVNFSGKGPKEPATISIHSITMGGEAIDLTDVYGQIEITLNITRNDQELDYVDVLIGNVVVATQDFANAAPADAAAGDGEMVTLNVPTTQVWMAENGWTPAVWNGGNEISALLYVTDGDQPIPTNKVPVVMQNEDRMLPGSAFGGDLAFTPDEPDRTAIGEDTEVWYAGTATFSGPQFLSYSTIVPDMVEFDISGPESCDVTDAITGTAATGILVTNTYDCDEEGTYEPQWWDFDVEYPTYVGPDGTAVGYDEDMAAIGAEFYLSDGTVGPRRFVIDDPEEGQIEDSNDLNLDNEAPDVSLDLPVAFNDLFSQYWVKGDYDFVANDVMSDDDGVGFVTEHAFLWVPGSPGSCTGIEVTTPDLTPLAETLVSDGDPDGYQICGYAYDALMNGAYTGASNFFGVDKVAPSARIWGDDSSDALAAGTAPIGDAAGTTPVSATMDETVYGTATMVGTGDFHYDVAIDATMAWGLDAIDDRSGLETNGTVGFPFVQTVSHDGVVPDGATTGADGYGTILSDNWVRVDAATPFLGGGTTDPGIYTYVGYAVDRAGNMSTVFTYNWLKDNVAVPATTAITPVATSYLVGAPAMFNVWGSDDLELMELGFHMTYPTSEGDVAFFYGAQGITGADRWDDVFGNTVVGAQYGTSTVWGRIDFTGADGTVPGGITYAPGEDALPIDVTVEFSEDAGYNPGDGSTATWTFIEYALGGWGTEDDLVEAPWDNENLDVFTISDTGTKYLVQQISNSSIDEFVMDEVWLVAFGDAEPYEMVFCAALDGENHVYSDNGTNRFYQYSFAYPAEGNPCYADDLPEDWSIRAVGVEGNALLVTDEEDIVPNPGS